MLRYLKKISIQSKMLFGGIVIVFGAFILSPTTVSFAHSHDRPTEDKGKNIVDKKEKINEKVAGDIKYCPITDFPKAIITNVSLSENGDSVSGKIELRNYSNYSFGSLKIALLVFDPEKPDRLFWSVLPDDYQLLGDEQKEFEFSLGLSYLPAGEYVVNAYLSQGNDVNLLGTVIQGLENIPKTSKSDNIFSFTKNYPPTKSLDVYFKIDGKVVEDGVYNYHPNNNNSLTTQVVSENKKNTIRNLNLLNVVTKGRVPLGEAVLLSKNDIFTLISSTTRSTKLSVYDYNNGLYGDYTVWSVFVDNEELQPLHSLFVNSQSPYTDRLAYFPFIGISNLTPINNSEVVACVNYLTYIKSSANTSEYSSPVEKGLLSPLAATLKMSNGKEFFYATTTSLNSDLVDYLTFKPNFKVVKSIQPVSIDFTGYNLIPKFKADNIHSKIDDFNLKPFTTNYKQKLYDKVVTNDNNSVVYTTKSPLYYVGIILASLLLLILMLRRLDTGPGFKSDISDEELH